jgi:hypothetical protein
MHKVVSINNNFWNHIQNIFEHMERKPLWSYKNKVKIQGEFSLYKLCRSVKNPKLFY